MSTPSVEAGVERRKQAARGLTAEKEFLPESRHLLDATVADAARLSGDLDAARS